MVALAQSPKIAVPPLFLLDLDVFLTHSHPDHILSLPLMLDSVGGLRSHPQPKDALHYFHEIEVGETYAVGGKKHRGFVRRACCARRWLCRSMHLCAEVLL